MTNTTTTQQEEKAIYNRMKVLEEERSYSHTDERGVKYRFLGDFLTDRERADKYMNQPPCKTPCDWNIPLRGGAKSWWKKVGYASHCRCAIGAKKVECGKEDLVGEI
tara:strand:+ start:4772 stop:5092 length:321 start_codon:yes stop_codon:yes gene_type:complete